jgi:hypothetical protein
MLFIVPVRDYEFCYWVQQTLSFEMNLPSSGDRRVGGREAGSEAKNEKSKRKKVNFLENDQEISEKTTYP